MYRQVIARVIIIVVVVVAIIITVDVVVVLLVVVIITIIIVLLKYYNTKRLKFLAIAVIPATNLTKHTMILHVYLDSRNGSYPLLDIEEEKGTKRKRHLHHIDHKCLQV